MTDTRSERSHAPLTDEHLDRLAALAAADHAAFQVRYPEWAAVLLAVCLAQGGARHRLFRDRGVKDLDVYLFYALPDGRSPARFPWNKGGTTRRQDFGPSEHGRQLYTSADRADPQMRSHIPQWELYAGRRVDLMSRAIAPHPDGPRAAVRRWLQRGLTRPSAGSTPWHLSRVPMICLYPEPYATWWQGNPDDEPGREKGVYPS
jgi:hypothetical protein